MTWAQTVSQIRESKDYLQISVWWSSGFEIRLKASANEGSECQIGSTVRRSGATLAQGAVVVHSRESSAPATRGNGKA
jgi:hypothetical protein